MNPLPRFPGALLLLVLSLPLPLPLSAAPVPITSATATDAQLTGLTIAGEQVLAAQLIAGNVTAFSGSSAVAVVAADGAPPAVNGRAGLLGDLFLNTGLINPAASFTACTYTFASPVVNRPGPDIVVMELNASSPTDGLAFRINGVSAAADTPVWGNTGITLAGLTDYSAGAVPATLAELQAATLTAEIAGQSLMVLGTALELSDYGVGAGGSVTTITFGARSAAAPIDPVLVMGITPPQTGGPVIAEIVAANSDGIEDEDTDRPDWVEIYNGQATAVNLAGWTLSDDPAVPLKWTFPPIALPAFGSTYVFASAKNRFTNLHAHTNFTLPKSGGILVLSRPDTALASTLTWGEQQDDISYGIFGGDQAKRFYETPTPGTPNSGRQAGAARVDGPVFSRESGVITAAATLIVSLPATANAAEGAVLRYTVNGTDPGETSPLVPASFTISSTANPNIAVRVFQPGRLPSRTAHRNFIWMTPDIGTNFNSTGAPFSSNLPIVVLDSYGVMVDGVTDPLGPRPYRFTKAAIYDVDVTSNRASLASPPTLLSRSATHVRGQSSSSSPQKPYAWEFWKDTADDDKRVELLGMPADSDWVLQTLYTDKTFQRNYLIQQLMLAANGAGPGHRGRFVEVFFNQDGGTCAYSDYRGVYLLMEGIRLGNNRLRIEKLNSEMTAPDKISGGYIFARDKNPIEYPVTPPDVAGSSWNGLTYDINEPLPPTVAQSTWLRNYLNQTTTAIMQSSFATPSSPNYYAKWLDPRSFIDKHIFQETCKESDSYVFSYYYYKDRAQPLKADLMWDVDRSLGNSNYASADIPFGWRWWTGGNGYAYFPRLFLDPEFSSSYWDRWWSLRQGLFATDALMARIEATALQLTNGADPALIVSSPPNLLQNPASRHFRKYPTLGTASYGQAPVGQTDRNTYRKELDLMKAWLATRLTWIDSQSPLLAPVMLNAATGLTQYGGGVSAGHAWRLFNPNAAGTVLYTINGPDPRQTGGTTHPDALTANTDRIALTTLMPAAQTWKWLRPASAPSITWKDETFNDTAWASGTAPLGYGESSGLTTNISPTAPNYSSATTEPNPAYFRTTFTATGLDAYQNVRLEIQADDGAVVFINGLEIARAGYAWPPTPPAFGTEASGMIDDTRAETAYNQITIPAASLKEGVNTIAVQVHQGYYAYPPAVTYPNNSYSDMRFDLRIIGVSSVPGGPAVSGTFTSPGPRTVRSRVKNGTVWSGLTESTFIVETVPAAANNLVVPEIHYHPAAPTAAESAAGFTSNNLFEFLELRNIHPTANLDLSGLTFTQGITFDFNNGVPEARYLPPGGRVVLVANQPAFTSRLNGAPAPLIAGTWTGSLSNSGETLTLLDAAGVPIKTFAYSDTPPWPTDADGTGRSLVLMQPAANPDHTRAYNWRASAAIHGTPGGEDALTLPPVNPLADDNNNGFPNQIDYLLGPAAALATVLETYITETGVPGTYLMVRFPRDLTAAGALTPELATDLSASAWSATALTFVGWDAANGTTAGMTWRSTEPVSTLGSKAFIRLRSGP